VNEIKKKNSKPNSKKDTHRSQLRAVFNCQFVDDRSNHPARAAPGCPEIHKHRHGRFENKLLPGIVVHSTCITFGISMVKSHPR
jgi:hypothetical protein